jgi:hypothetical protein
MMSERRLKGTRSFTLEELSAWWESEGTLALLPKGCIPEETCQKAHFAITQLAPRAFHNGLRDALVRYCEIDGRACFVYTDRVIMRNPIEIRKVIDTLKPFVRLPKRKAQIKAFERFYKARKHLFRAYVPKPKLRKTR